MVMRRAILLLALLTPSMAAAAAPASRGLWVDWSELSRRAAAQPASPAAGDPRSVERARALGDRVGRMVAAGDCRGGERAALEAGDSQLVQAVRAYCLR
jgi:hypothetical protein